MRTRSACRARRVPIRTKAVPNTVHFNARWTVDIGPSALVARFGSRTTLSNTTFSGQKPSFDSFAVAGRFDVRELELSGDRARVHEVAFAFAFEFRSRKCDRDRAIHQTPGFVSPLSP